MREPLAFVTTGDILNALALPMSKLMFLLYNENSNNIETSTLALTRFKAQQPAPPVATAVAMAADQNPVLT